MKKQILIALLLLAGRTASAQVQHLFEHDYPVIAEVNPEIRAMMDFSAGFNAPRSTYLLFCRLRQTISMAASI